MSWNDPNTVSEPTIMGNEIPRRDPNTGDADSWDQTVRVSRYAGNDDPTVRIQRPDLSRLI